MRQETIAGTLITLVVINATRYYLLMIRPFARKETKALFQRERARKIPSNLQPIALRKLRMLDAAISLEDLRMPPASADTALRLSRYFGTSAKFWLNLQTQYDLDIQEEKIISELETAIKPFRKAA